MKKLEDYVVSIPDFPEPGIIFRDITSILQDPDGFKLAIDSLLAMVKDVWLSARSPEDLFLEHRLRMRWENPLSRQENRVSFRERLFLWSMP